MSPQYTEAAYPQVPQTNSNSQQSVGSGEPNQAAHAWIMDRPRPKPLGATGRETLVLHAI